MKKKILLSALFMALFSITSVFSMETEDLEEKQISFKVRYYNKTLSDRKKFDNVSFTLRCRDGEKEETMGSFTFNVGAEVPVAPGFITYSHGEDKIRTSSLSLNQKKPWEITLYPEGDSNLKTLYGSDGVSHIMKWSSTPAVFSPDNIGPYSFLIVDVHVVENPEMSGDIRASHTLSIRGL
ncbi:hypothetical protein QM565_22415 [Geitlerinema splendidum]|jgi:hypothetical protein|nr:hypothetical protein [Geitlerinema splendidum]